MQKDFDVWNFLKKKLDKDERDLLFKEREIWWCSIGLNLSHEENGKSHIFTRPVLIFKKFNRNLFLGIPLSTIIKQNKYYFRATFKNREQSFMLSQIKSVSSKRMRSKIGELPKDEFEKLKEEVKKIFFSQPS